jgi:hypothetical protein
MDFGELDENTFYIEESDIYKNKLNSAGVRMVEFLRIKPKGNKENMLIIEAKTSFPKEFDSNLNEIAEKLYASIMLIVAIYHERHENRFEELPERFRKADIFSMEYVFILIIRKHDDYWLDPIRMKLRDKLNMINKVWRFSDIFVFNEMMAKKKKIIV